MLAHRNENVVLANLERWGAAFDEVIVGVDSRAGNEFVQLFEGVVDRLFVVSEIEAFANSAWLTPLATSDWALVLDSDEIISESLGRYLSDRVHEAVPATQIALPMRWVWPSANSFLADEPWRFDPQVRLLNLQALQANYPTKVHEAVVMEGPTARIRPHLYHLDLLINSIDERQRKAATYNESDSLSMPGFNKSISEVYYLPESRTVTPRTLPLDVADAEVIDEALLGNLTDTALRERVTERFEISVSELHEIGRKKYDYSSANLADIEIVTPPTVAISGMAVPCEVEVVNRSRRTFWPRRDGRGIAVGWSMTDSQGLTLAEGRGDLTSELKPGDSQVVLCWLLVSEFSGDATVEFKMVDEGVAWFDGVTTSSLHVIDDQSLFD